MAKNLGKKGRISASQPNYPAQASQSEERNRSETAFFPAYSGGNEQAEEKDDVKEEDTNSDVIIVESSSEEASPARRLF